VVVLDVDVVLARNALVVSRGRSGVKADLTPRVLKEPGLATALDLVEGHYAAVVQHLAVEALLFLGRQVVTFGRGDAASLGEVGERVGFGISLGKEKGLGGEMARTGPRATKRPHRSAENETLWSPWPRRRHWEIPALAGTRHVEQRPFSPGPRRASWPSPQTVSKEPRRGR
jgi:hypothetical protein